MGDTSAAAISGPVVPHQDLPTPAGVRSTFRDPGAQARFAADGFLTVDFLDPVTIARVLEVCTGVGPAPGDDRDGYFPGNVSSSPAWKRTVIAEITPLVAGRIEELFDRHHTFHLTFMTKWPGPGGRLQVHQDPTMVDLEGRFRSVNVWCPLTAADPADGRERGMVRVVPGSTHLPTANWYRARGGHVPSGLETVEDLVYERLAEPVSLELGRALVLDHRLVHCSPPNQTDAPRFVLAVGLRPEESPSVHVECDAEGWVDFFEVDDEYFIQHPDVDVRDYPLLRRIRSSPGPSVRRADLEVLLGRAIEDPERPVDVGDTGSPVPESPTVTGGRRPTALPPTAPPPVVPLDERVRASASSWRMQWSWHHWLPARLARLRARSAQVLLDPEADRRLDRDGFVRVTWFDGPPVDGLRRQAPDGDLAEEFAAAVRRTFSHHVPVPGTLERVSRLGDREVGRAWTFTDEDQGIRAFVVYVAIEDRSGSEGLLEVARGSHRLDRMVRGTNLLASWLDHPEVWARRLLTVPLRPGEAVVLDAALVHAIGAHPGDGLAYRAVVVPHDATLVHHRRLDAMRAERHEVPADFFAASGLVPVAEGAAPPGIPVPTREVHLGPVGLARRLDAQPLAVLDRLRRLR